MSTSLGGLPFCQGTSPCFSNQSPMAELRNSGHVVQNARGGFTTTGIPSTSTTTTSHFLLKNFFTFSRPTLTPSATPLRALNFPFFQAATSKANLQGDTVRPAYRPYSIAGRRIESTVHLARKTVGIRFSVRSSSRARSQVTHADHRDAQVSTGISDFNFISPQNHTRAALSFPAQIAMGGWRMVS